MTLVSHEGDRAVGLLRDVVERFAADGGHRRRRAEHEQHLLLRGAERDLLERAVGQHVAALEGLAGAAGEREREQQRHKPRSTRPASATRKIAPHPRSLTCVQPPRAVPPKRKIGNRPPCEPVATTSVNLMILRLFRPSSQDRSIRDLYGAIVAQARSPAFYRDYRRARYGAGPVRPDRAASGAADRPARPPGRRRAGVAGIGQQLFDVFCRDLDANLREMGVGDLAVPKRMRGFGEAFYGRQAAYLAALAAADERELEKALAAQYLSGADATAERRGLPRYVARRAAPARRPGG